MIKRLYNLFIWLCTIIIVMSPTSLRAATADDYKTYEYYKSAGLDYINAAEAYALGYTGAGIILSLLDQPVRIDHQEFNFKDYINRYSNLSYIDWEADIDHGTHVAGIMAANKDGVGMHGVAFEAGILSLGTQSFSEDDVRTLYSKLFENPLIKIINNSWGAPEKYPEYVLPEDFKELAESIDGLDVFEEAVIDYDKVLVWAAGNNGHISSGVESTMGYANPELNKNIINVIAFDPAKKPEDINFLASFSEHALFVEENSIAAPGVNIYSAVTAGNGDRYDFESGTSMAAPFVSGSLGLVQQAFPYMNGKQLVDTVLSTANNDFFEDLTYTVAIQTYYDDAQLKNKINSIYLVYFDNSNPTRADRERHLRDYYDQTPAAKNIYGFETADDFVNAYFNGYDDKEQEDYPYYGKDRYYLNVPPEIMFGQGILDVGKAVRGPGLLNARRLSNEDYNNNYSQKQALYTINTQGYNSVWSNNIGEKKVEEYSNEYRDFYIQLYGALFENGMYDEDGEAPLTRGEGEEYGKKYWEELNDDIEQNPLYELPVGLLKTGEGILALEGANTYRGDSIVRGGTLQIDGSVFGNAYSESDGTIAGSGTIGGFLTNHGAVQPGSWSDAGKLKVVGDFTSDGVIKIIIQDNTNGYLDVTGHALVDGSRVVASGIAVPGLRYNFLNANSIAGTLYGVQFSPFLKTNPDHNNTTAWFDVEKYAKLNSLANLNSSQMTSATALENMYAFMEEKGQIWPNELLLVYNSPTEAVAKAVFQETYGSTQTSLAASLPLKEQFGPIINSRFSSLKWHDTLAQDSDWWVKFIEGGKTVKADGDLGLPEIKPQRSGFITGYDKKINKSWRLGALFGYGRGKLFTPHSRGDSQDRRLGLYGNYNRQALDVNMYLAAGRQSHDVKRNLSSFALTADSNYKGNTWEMGVKAKYDLHHGREKAWHIAPYAALDVERYSQDGYSENGAGVLSQQGEKLLNIYSTAGVGLEVSRKINKGHYLVTAGYKRVLNGGNPEIKVAFAGNPQDKFPLRSNRESRDWLVLGFNAEGELAKNWTVSAALQGEFSARGNNRSASITFKRYW